MILVLPNDLAPAARAEGCWDTFFISDNLQKLRGTFSAFFRSGGWQKKGYYYGLWKDVQFIGKVIAEQKLEWG